MGKMTIWRVKCLAKVALTGFLNNPTPDFLDGVNLDEY